MERVEDRFTSQYCSKSLEIEEDRENLFLVVVLPLQPKYYEASMNDPTERVQVYDWWVENLVAFVRRLQWRYKYFTTGNETWQSICTEANSGNRALGYPNSIVYQWKKDKTFAFTLPVGDYIENTFSWCASHFSREDIFPSGKGSQAGYPVNFEDLMKKIYGSLFRVVNIIFTNECLYKRKGWVEKEEISCFRHFLFFGWRWNLLPSDEMQHMTNDILVEARADFEEQQKAYRAQTLSYEDDAGKGKLSGRVSF